MPAKNTIFKQFRGFNSKENFMRLSILALLLSVLNGYIANAQNATNAPKYSNEFLSLGVGADAFGMGNAVVSTTAGANATYWNPAGLVNTNKWLEVSFMHSEYFAGIAKYDFLGVAHQIDEKSAFGFSAIRFGVDDIPNTTQLIDNNGVINYDNISRFSAGDYAFIGSYARRLGVEGLSFGGSIKVVYRQVGDFAKSYGFGLDAGLQYHLGKNWKFGFMARDVSSTFNAWVFDLSPEVQNTFINTGNAIPENGLEITLPRFILAAGGSFDIGEKGFKAGGEINLSATTDGRRNTLISAKPFSIDPNVGAFVGFRDLVKVRGGISNIQRFTDMDDQQTWGLQPHLGMGLTFKGFTLDYAFTRLGAAEANYYTHIFSVKLRLDKPQNAKK